MRVLVLLQLPVIFNILNNILREKKPDDLENGSSVRTHKHYVCRRSLGFVPIHQGYHMSAGYCLCGTRPGSSDMLRANANLCLGVTGTKANSLR